MVKFTFNASISATCWLCNSVFSFFIILSIMSWSVLDPVGFSFFAFFLPSHVFFHCRLHLVHPWLQFILHLLKLHSLFRPLLLNGLKVVGPAPLDPSFGSGVLFLGPPRSSFVPGPFLSHKSTRHPPVWSGRVHIHSDHISIITCPGIILSKYEFQPVVSVFGGPRIAKRNYYTRLLFQIHNAQPLTWEWKSEQVWPSYGRTDRGR